MADTKKELTRKDYLQMIQAPLVIAGATVHFAEPTVARMEAINDLIGFDLWESNPSTDSRVRKLLMVRFDSDNTKVEELCRQVLQTVPDDLDFNDVTGVELGALLQGFFIFFHVRAGTIDVTLKLTQQPMEPTE
jgi:hypothetical protein